MLTSMARRAFRANALLMGSCCRAASPLRFVGRMPDEKLTLLLSWRWAADRSTLGDPGRNIGRRHRTRLKLEHVKAGGPDLLPRPALAALCRQGAVDMAWQTEPWITRAQDAGAADLWLALADVLPQVQNSVIAFGPSVLRDNPAAGERFVTAYLKGARQYAEGKTERNLQILEKYMELDRALLEKMCFPYVPADGAILTQSIAEFSQWAAARDYIDRPLTPEMFWESRFVEHANAALGVR